MMHYNLMRPASHFTPYRDRQLMYSLGDEGLQRISTTASE